MTALIQAIRAKFVATGAITTAFPGGLHAEGQTQPNVTAGAYMTYNVIAAPTDYRFGLKKPYTATIVFTAWCAPSASESSAQLATAKAETFCTTFDAGLTIAYDTHRITQPVPRPQVGPLNSDVQKQAAVDVTYTFSVQP